MVKITPILTDITMMKVDVIANAANETMAGGGGVDGAIHQAAGPKLVQETIKHAPLYVANIAITEAYNLRAKNIIHTVGPVYHHGNSGEYLALKMCYKNILKAADELGARTVAIPAISTGVFGFPVSRAAKIAVETTITFAKNAKNLEEVILVAFDDNTLDAYNNLIK